MKYRYGPTSLLGQARAHPVRTLVKLLVYVVVDRAAGALCAVRCHLDEPAGCVHCGRKR